MYHDDKKYMAYSYPNQFRDLERQNLVQIDRIRGAILISSYRDTDGEGVHVLMTDYEANRLIEHLQKLLNEK